MGKKEGASRVKGRNLADSSEGWFTLRKSCLQAWCPKLRCAQSSVLHDGVNVANAETVRKIEIGELLEAMEVPVLDSGVLRVRVRLEKDGAIGFATVRGNEGRILLEPLVARDV